MEWQDTTPGGVEIQSSKHEDRAFSLRSSRFQLFLLGADMIETPDQSLAPARFAATATETPRRAAKVAAALTAVPGEAIDGGEVVILAVKPSMWRPVLDSMPWLVTCLLLATALMWLGRPLPGLSVSGTAQVILLIALVRFAAAVVHWIPTWYVLTNRRVLSIHGVRAPRIAAFPLTQIRNASLHASFAEKAAGLGSIGFVTDDSTQVTLVWHSITQPETIHAKVRRAIENASGRH